LKIAFVTTLALTFVPFASVTANIANTYSIITMSTRTSRQETSDSSYRTAKKEVHISRVVGLVQSTLECIEELTCVEVLSIGSEMKSCIGMQNAHGSMWNVPMWVDLLLLTERRIHILSCAAKHWRSYNSPCSRHV
jgi:hypothetical protein